jgi:hypothetical protein
MLDAMVAQNSPSTDLPALYRAVLDGIAELERRGQRSTAAQIRRDAIAAYSAAWDDHHRALLASLTVRVKRELDRPSRARASTRTLSRRRPSLDPS